MNRTALAAGLTTAVAVAVTLIVVPSGVATAHGTMSDPPSRIYQCRFNENPENPTSSGCRAARDLAGSAPFYDWNEVSLLTAGGRHRELIPDGKLCSAGRDKYRGLDLARADWAAKRISAGPLRITYHASAPHSNSNFEFYITRAGWSPTQPLRWSDLVHIQTFNNQNPTTFTNWTINIPARSGRHIIYSIWQRVVGSEEAFYTCSDVDFGGGTTPPSPSPSPTASPTASPSPTTSPTGQPGGTWQAGTTYQVGSRVTYMGLTYECRQGHTALPGWEPPNAPALWTQV